MLQIWFFLNNIFLHFEMVVVVEWGQASYKLIQQHSQTIKIKRSSICLALQNLRTEILWASTNGFSVVFGAEVFLGEAKVC